MTEDKGAQRAIYTFISIVVIIIIIAIYGCASDGEKAESGEQLYQGVTLDKHLIELDKKALESAYQDHLKLLWSVWLKDGTGVVDRINKGLRNAREAYGVAAARIEQREKELEKQK